LVSDNINALDERQYLVLSIGGFAPSHTQTQNALNMQATLKTVAEKRARGNVVDNELNDKTIFKCSSRTKEFQ
jgi:hypothetical protein